MTQGERVKEVRKTLGLTLEKFGEKIGVTKTAISRIEKSERNLTEQMTKSICREFNVDYIWLTTGEGKMFIEFDREEQLMIWANSALGDKENFKSRFIDILMRLSEEEWEWLEQKALELTSTSK
jgi:hypothetical protein